MNPPTTILGWTRRDTGAMLTEGLPLELVAQLPQLGWEFTDRRPGSPTEGLTVYVAAGSGDEEVRWAIECKSRRALEQDMEMLRLIEKTIHIKQHHDTSGRLVCAEVYAG